jgi:hypothetical protein
MKKDEVQTKRRHVSVKLEAGTLNKLKYWMEQTQNILHGGRIRLSDLVNWYISRAPEDLAAAELEELRLEHQDEASRARWIYFEILRARREGTNLTLEELLIRSQNSTGPTKIGKKRKKNLKPENAPSSVPTEAPDESSAVPLPVAKDHPTSDNLK